ncbi:hypothetical protein, partial [Streptomyces chryseus]|uniref:hypothetical protein n=1 Tax=Streptomyces chryseus TaxID=68186 RepID=UPI001E41DC78
GSVYEPITGSLPPYEWDSEQSVSYEAAIEAINGVVGAYSALIAREEEKPEAARDEAALAEWDRLCGECQKVREQLDPQDDARVHEIRARFARTYRELTAG